jgi:hypothetical protein
MNRIRFSACLFLSLLATACGGGRGAQGTVGQPGDTLTEEKATQAFGSMQSAMGGAVAKVQDATVGKASGRVEVSAPCSGGGSVSATGAWVTGESLSLDLGFDGCEVQGVAIDGELSYDATGDSTHVTLTVEGQLDFSGAVTGSCDVDLTVDVTAARTQVDGSVCGFDVHQTGPGPGPGTKR